MINRILQKPLSLALDNFPVVALLGPRQVGKTTLAHALESPHKTASYLDLELESDLARLDDAEAYLRRYDNQLLIIDEVQRKPDLFTTLRSLVDMRKRNGERSAHFLLLGSASRDLLQHSSETLAGRIAYLELTPFNALEALSAEGISFNIEKLWFRGGFPDSYLASSSKFSWDWRSNFLSTYVERDLPSMGVGFMPERMKRFWKMLAHYNGQQANLSEIGKSLEVSHTTIKNYLDALGQFYMVRLMPPWSGNSKKRIMKTPKVFLRDSGLLHSLLNISTFDDLLSHPLCGASWEGFVIENIISLLDDRWQYSYYRSGQQEIDLVLEGPKKPLGPLKSNDLRHQKYREGFTMLQKKFKRQKNLSSMEGEKHSPCPKIRSPSVFQVS